MHKFLFPDFKQLIMHVAECSVGVMIATGTLSIKKHIDYVLMEINSSFSLTIRSYFILIPCKLLLLYRLGILFNFYTKNL